MTEIPSEVREYLDIVELVKFRTCKEQKQLAKYIRKIFEEEELIIDKLQIAKYFSYQKYFPFMLFPWEKFCFVLHNCVFTPEGDPRWSEMLILIGRGGGKNAYLSFEDFCLITDTNGISEYDIDICANSEEQAKTTFKDIYNILENPKHKTKLRKHFRWTKTEIQNLKTLSTIKFRTDNPKTKDGLRSGKVDFDEVHAYENWDNLNVFTTGLGKKEHPRKTYVTTNGDVRDCVLDQLIEKSRQILEGEIPDNGFLPFICRLDDVKEVHDPDNWEKANPSLPYRPTLMKQMKREYADYLLDPIKNSSFMVKRMNIPQGRKDTEVASWENILKTNKDVPDLTGKTCVCGIDFSKTTDFVSVFLLFKQHGTYYGIHHSWFCVNSNDRSRIKIPLEEMVERGLLTMVEDVEISADIVANWIYEKRMLYDIEKIAIDSYRFSYLSKALKDVGYDANEKQIKLVRPSDVMLVQQKVNSLFLNNKIIWGDDPLMRWYTNNTKLEPAPNNNFKYEKIEAKSRKTDGFMAFVAAMTLEEEIPEAPNYDGFMEVLIF